MSQTPNIVAPQPGLVSTNPFLSSSAPKTSGTTTGLLAPNNTSLTPNYNSGVLSSQPGLLGQFASSVNGTSSTKPVTSSINFGSLVPNSSTAPNPGLVSTPNSNSQISPYQQNLSKYGLSSIPTGYSFNANGSLVNGSGQEYVSPSSGNIPTAPSTTPSSSQVATNSGGINASGQATPGYVPVPQVNAPNNPNTATGSTFNNDVGTESQIAAQPSAAFTQAQTAYQSTAQQLAALQASAAQQNANISGSRTNLAEAGGEQGILQNLVAGQESALTGEMTAEQSAAQNATAQQGTQQTGLGQAAGLVAPQPGQSPATQTFNPATGQYSGLAALNAGGTSGETAQGALANLGQTLGGEAAGASIVPLQQALAAGTGAADNITSYLQENPNLNSSSLNLANLANQWIGGQFSSAQYQTLGNYLTTFATQMAPLLAPGGTVTDASRALQQSLINGQASGQSIQQVLAQLTSEAQATLTNRASGAAGGGTVSGGSSVTNVPGGTSQGGTTFGTNFFSSS